MVRDYLHGPRERVVDPRVIALKFFPGEQGQRMDENAICFCESSAQQPSSLSGQQPPHNLDILIEMMSTS